MQKENLKRKTNSVSIDDLQVLNQPANIGNSFTKPRINNFVFRYFILINKIYRLSLHNDNKKNEDSHL